MPCWFKKIVFFIHTRPKSRVERLQYITGAKALRRYATMKMPRLNKSLFTFFTMVFFSSVL